MEDLYNLMNKRKSNHLKGQPLSEFLQNLINELKSSHLNWNLFKKAAVYRSFEKDNEYTKKQSLTDLL